MVFEPGRYGRLTPGSREYARRVRQRPDYRALRLVRSEMYASIQSVGVSEAEYNPACLGLVDWILTSGAQHSCICPDLARSGPYELDRVPT